MERVHSAKYIFVTGGVLSGLGKGITAASIGTILQARGLKVSIQKCDPYLNVDAGLLNPAEHGECFVTRDGAETDLDLGHYERFLDIEMTQASSTMGGRLLAELIQTERAGKMNGKTVQLVPHFTNSIQEAIISAGKGSDVHIVEIGGTVGDMEASPFLEAIRELASRVGYQNCIFAYVVYVPYLGTSKEFKSKPAQNAVRDLRSLGIMPDLLLARMEEPSKNGIADKLSMFSGVRPEGVVLLPNARTVYEVPLTLEEHGIGDLVCKQLGLQSKAADMTKWRQVVAAATGDYQKTVKIGLVVKYLDNDDTYFSVVESLRSAAWQQKVKLSFEWVSAEQLETEGTDGLKEFDGLLIPGGFGDRGLEGMIMAADYAIKNKVPYLGICLGLQMAVIAAARQAGLAGANTTEANNDTPYDVIYIMQGQRGKESTGGTMRLGNYTCKLADGSLAERVYGTKEIVERHRHRYEVNQKFAPELEKVGLIISGTSPDHKLVEMVEHQDHPYFIATQAHPEFLSRPFRAHPLFVGLIAAAASNI
ncbi:MAG TPA: CTP synthase [Patescibacteria group bacterium]|jgi:CTP synthase|nr:CTP synthase [Patescibacteria group bacterium]